LTFPHPAPTLCLPWFPTFFEDKGIRQGFQVGIMFGLPACL
jgi:hypothetical protein